jgi:hypothetical protein
MKCAAYRNVKDYLPVKVLPHVPDAYIDETFLDKADESDWPCRI